MVPKSFDLVSPLARDECVRRLRASTDRWWPPSGSKPVVGRIDNTSFRLAKRIPYRNSFQTYLRGELLDEDGRTRVRCRLGMHPVIIAFATFWFGLVVAGMAMSAVSGDRRSIAALVFPLVGGAALVGFGRFAARDEPQFLLDFMREVIAAREA